jgi:acyl-CoA thioester hydrolase
VEKIEFNVPIYTFQIDFAGHVSNIVYIQWMEIARTELLRAIGLAVEDLFEKGIAPILKSTEIVYKEALYLGDQVRVQVWLSELRHASARMEIRFYKDGDVLAASGSQLGLFFDLKAMRPYRLSREMRTAFQSYLAPSPG